MNIPGIPSPYVIGGAALVLMVGMAGSYIKGRGDGTAIADAKWLKVETERKDAVAKTIADAEARFRANEVVNAKKTLALETKSNEDDTRIHGLRIANGRLVAAHGGLYDRNGRQVGGRGGDAPGASPGATVEAAGDAAGCRLSDELSEFFQSEAERADSAAAYAQLGHDYAVAVKAWRDKHQETSP